MATRGNRHTNKPQSATPAADVASPLAQKEEICAESPIVLHEEVLEPILREKRLGRAVVQKRVETVENDVTLDLQRQFASVERRPIGKVVETAPGPYWDGDTWVLPLVEEEVVLQKRLVVREEVRITLESGTDRQVIPASIRREIVEISEEMDPVRTSND